MYTRRWEAIDTRLVLRTCAVLAGLVEAIAPTAPTDGARMRGALRAVAAVRVGADATVKTHAGGVPGKSQAVNRALAITPALQRGLVSLEELE